MRSDDLDTAGRLLRAMAMTDTEDLPVWRLPTWHGAMLRANDGGGPELADLRPNDLAELARRWRTFLESL